MKKYIYIDTKIKGAITQLISYYKSGVFTPDCTVIFKLYRENKTFLADLRKYHINYITFSNYSNFPKLEKSIVFYLFNAQSNCRVVAHREAKHIFVTHGESNKLPSVKPILRIYDYVIVAGKAGVDRLLESGIFSNCDIENGKLIQMGNTFIGNAKYIYSSNTKSILYAPTWEGGLEVENYTSISRDGKNFFVLISYMKENNLDDLVIQIHPNLGHRDPRYLYYLYQSIRYAIDEGITVRVREVNLKFIGKPLHYYFKSNKMYISQDDTIPIKEAFCDISAMETQLLDREIPTHVFFKDRPIALPSSPLLDEYYRNVAVNNALIQDISSLLTNGILKEVKAYYIAYEDTLFENMDYKERITWLSERVCR